MGSRRKVQRVAQEAITTRLPEDLVFEILKRLPAKSLMRLKCVSKTWNTLISDDSSFSDAYQRQRHLENGQHLIVSFRHYAKEPQRLTVLSEHFSKGAEIEGPYNDLVQEYGEVEISGSCNGLVCLWLKKLAWRVGLWNPATRKLRHLPDLPCSLIKSLDLGLDTVSGDYKVVRLIFIPFKAPLVGTVTKVRSVRAHVFAKSGTVWRDGGSLGIEGFPIEKSAVEADGALHWLLYRPGARSAILSFGLSDEVLRSAEGPPEGRHFSLFRWRSSLASLAYDGFSHEPCHLCAVTSSSGGRLRWSKIMKFTPPVEKFSTLVWSENFLALKVFRHGWELWLVDSEAPHVAKKLLQPRPIGDWTATVVCEYVETLLSCY